ncbi:MAG TPA: hypothetical protein VHU92_29340 [Streptosporangiaceae bacterium]|jgi:hypothetical protein|nr:hypothetical protein [Streptosporangiaceae bacterium]
MLAVAALAGVAACGGQAPARHVPPPARVERASDGQSSVVLSRAGLQRLGLQTAPAQPAAGRSGMVLIPYAALLYQPDGSTAVYTVTGLRTYTRLTISVSKIQGSQVYVSRGLPAGAQVVTAGAEELLGVQDGVGVQT